MSRHRRQQKRRARHASERRALVQAWLDEFHRRAPEIYTKRLINDINRPSRILQMLKHSNPDAGWAALQPKETT